ncbi:uncharacterized protein METZ01_LOCUS46701 [marine metagenome]|uniref:Uncharacterized protein n=1 Tax=marine metagenome TaxID=408172 RepID=A0A381RV56_9ZZZZ
MYINKNKWNEHLFRPPKADKPVSFAAICLVIEDGYEF